LDRLGAILKRAGLPAVVTPAHFIAWIACSALLGGAMMGGLAIMQGWNGAMWLAGAGGLAGGVGPVSRVWARIRRRRRDIDRALPFVLDMMTLCVESGVGWYSALQYTERHAPPG